MYLPRQSQIVGSIKKIGAAKIEGKTLYPPGCMSYYSINIF